ADPSTYDHMKHTPVRVIGQQHPEHVVNGLAGHQPFGEGVSDAGTNRCSSDIADMPAADPLQNDDAGAGAGRDDGENRRKHRGDYFTWRPPSMRTVSPVMKPASRSASTAFATSSSLPQWPSGVASSTARRSSSLNVGGGTIGPRAMALTRMLSDASSSASASVSA